MKPVFLLLLSAFTTILYAQNPKIKPGLVTKINITKVQMNQLTTDYKKLNAELKELKAEQAKIEMILQELQAYNKNLKAYTTKLKTWEQKIDSAGGDSQQQLLQATKQMEEIQMSFNLQYLQLQSQMQNENRSYTALSNIMKTKHDTVKNSISNVR